MSVQFFNEDVSAQLKAKRALKKWILYIIGSRGRSCGEVNIIFCSDAYLEKMNKVYLDHDTLTDVITFDFCEGDLVAGDIFISWDRTRENADLFHVKHCEEVHRVIVHGLLHLLGEKDKLVAQQKRMRKAEDAALLILREFLNKEGVRGEV